MCVRSYVCIFRDMHKEIGLKCLFLTYTTPPSLHVTAGAVTNAFLTIFLGLSVCLNKVSALHCPLYRGFFMCVY